MTRVITPLEDEINSTNSYWVKIRNRVYISVLRNSIVASIQKKIQEL